MSNANFMLDHPAFSAIVIIGFLVMVSGTVVGNIAVYNMVKVVNISRGPEADPPDAGGGKAKQAQAIKIYRATQKDGRFYKMLQFGWVLNGLGFLTIVGSFLMLS